MPHGLQVRQQLGRGAVALGLVFCQRLDHNPVQLWRQSRICFRGRLWYFVQDPVDCTGERRGQKRVSRGEQFVKDYTQRKKVRTPVRLLPQEHLRRHVGRRAAKGFGFQNSTLCCGILVI